MGQHGAAVHGIANNKTVGGVPVPLPVVTAQDPKIGIREGVDLETTNKVILAGLLETITTKTDLHHMVILAMVAVTIKAVI